MEGMTVCHDANVFVEVSRPPWIPAIHVIAMQNVMYTQYWNLCSEDTTGTTINTPVLWNLYNKDAIGTVVSDPI